MFFRIVGDSEISVFTLLLFFFIKSKSQISSEIFEFRSD